MGRVLVTFDVDGTLVRSVGTDANQLHKAAFRHAHVAVFGPVADVSIDVIRHHGCTDPMVSARTLGAVGISAHHAAERWPEVSRKMVEYVNDHGDRAAVGLDVLPGVLSLLEQLQSRGCLVGLVTGNLEPIGWAKMRALGLHHLFTSPNFGGFGSDHSERGELVAIAGRRARELFPDIEIAAHWHVGDTPADVQAAVFGGARALGVCTGIFSRDELLQANPKATVVTDLADIDAVLNILLG
jgi:phosphoglycolate phosphatase